MSITRLLAVVHGNATDAWAIGDKAREDNFFRKMKATTDILTMGGVGMRNLYVGGAQSEISPVGTATGNFALWNALPIEIDNTDDQLSDFVDSYGATLIVRFNFLVRVSNALINITPKVYNKTLATYATVTGAAACSSTQTDYLGTNQDQSVYLTLATGLNTYVPHYNIAGTPSAGYTVNAYAKFDLFIDF